LAGYLLHGPQAVGVGPETWNALKPSRTHWCPATRNYARPDPGLKDPALAGYAHLRLNAARAAKGDSIELFDIGKLIKFVERLHGGRTQDEVVALIDTIAAQWPAVVGGLPPWMTTPPLLDESVLANGHVIESAKRVAAGLPPQHAKTTTVTTPRKEGKYAHCYS
jgi:hypothetical protein